MTPVSTLYHLYIDWRKLSEQKNPFEYIVPPPSRGVGTIIHFTQLKNQSTLISHFTDKQLILSEDVTLW